MVQSELRALFWLSALHIVHIRAVYIPGACNTGADVASRFHVRGSLLLFNSILQTSLSHVTVADLTLSDHMSVYSSIFLFLQAHAMTN